MIEIKNELQLRDFFKDTDEIRVLKRNGYRGVLIPVMRTISGTTLAQNSVEYTTPFFYADRTYQILEVYERHEVKGSNAGSVTLMLKKVPNGTAPSSGVDTLLSALSLKTDNNTWQKGEITTTHPNFIITRGNSSIEGDSLSLVTTGTLTDLQGVSVAIILKAL